MLRSTREIMGYRLSASDGDIGHLRDLYFDDHSWIVRYAVIDTGNILPGEKVLIAPTRLGEPIWDQATIPVNMTMEQIKESPGIKSELTVSEQRELDINKYNVWSPRWVPLGKPITSAPRMPEEKRKLLEREDLMENPFLRSYEEVRGYTVHAKDGEIGSVFDFVTDVDKWIIRYLAIDIGSWLNNEKRIIAPDWIRSIGWNDRKIQINMTKDDIKDGPRYDPRMPVERKFEAKLYDFYGRPVYW